MGRVRGWLVLWVGAAPLTAVARPDDPGLPADPSLARLIEESIAARPELASAQAVQRATALRPDQAGALPDPMLQLGIQNDGFTSLEVGRMETSFVSIMASQTIPWPGIRPLRSEAARLDAVRSAQTLARVRLSTEAEVRRGYLDLLLVRGRLALLEQLTQIWQDSLSVATARYETGEGAQSDVLRAQLELNRVRQRRLSQSAIEQGKLLVLNRLRNATLDAPIATPIHLKDLATLDAHAHLFDEAKALQRSPELQSARLSVTRSEVAVALAERSYYPDLTLTAGLMFRGELPPMWLVTVGFPMTVLASQKRDLALEEQREWSSSAGLEATTLEQLLRLRTRERAMVFSTLQQIVALYERGLLVQSEATTQSTLSQYRVGRVSFASVLEANAGFIADQEGYLESIAAAHRLLIAGQEVSLAETPMPTEGRSGGMSAPETTMPAAAPGAMPSDPGPAIRGAAPAAM
ncbi:MAG: TolC family protein [Deltaproteobacteria bacterium]|nr:TolC family protein [Deltaproteobacteria bacterium]